MSRFNDAIGYLLELRATFNQAWFHAACDIAIASTGRAYTDAELIQLWDLFTGTQNYQPIAAVPPVLAPGAPAPSPVSLRKISSFNGFKKLTTTLDLQMNRQVTLIFGKNGSGKSSLCQALKILSVSEVPDTPIHNVRHNPPRPTPTFTYRIHGAPADVTWSPATGYGVERNLIKYFDSAVSLKHATGDIDTDAAVEVVLFRLEIFGFARAIVQSFQRFATSRVLLEKQQASSEIVQIKSDLARFVDITSDPFLSWTHINSQNFSNYINQLPEFTGSHRDELESKKALLAQNEAVRTEEGLRTAIAEQILLTQLENKIFEFKRITTLSRVHQIEELQSTLSQKRAAQSELSRQFFPPNVDPSQQRALVIASANLLDLSSVAIESSHCPLCAQSLDNNAVHLFHQYHSYLHSSLQEEATSLERELIDIQTNLTSVRRFVFDNYNACQIHLPQNFIGSLNELIANLIRLTPADGIQVNKEAIDIFSRIPELDQYLQKVREVNSSLVASIALAQADRQALTENISRLKNDIASLIAHEAVWNNKVQLLDICSRTLHQNRIWRTVDTYNFAGLFSALTRKGREAHTDLVRDAFEQSLSAEYQNLCGASTQQMGVSLKSIGDQQSIIVSPLVGDEAVHRVFSEGEQKVHALAVFFCEAARVPHQVLVFDDPVTSFDYNNVSNFAERLRTLTRSQPNTQIIILTHNWDFFINLQQTMNRSGLEASLSVQVLEDCATVSEYVENWDMLCGSIDVILNQVNEPSPEQKEKVAGLMRRLIERLNNQFVFNEMRHQYKAKALPASEFHKFVKLVPLLVPEADALRDLYANLSPPEHDDIRNFYVTKSKLQFATWYANIKSIATSVHARRPA